MNSLVVVAIPTEDDYVHKISSQKVPHLTILYLGEDATKVDDVPSILDFCKHASEMSLERFGLDVDRRGELGEDPADVLFFAKNKYSGYPLVHDFRSYLLKDDNIRKAYDAAKQFDGEWVPHLTLGYPDSPAKPDDRDYPGINYVSFDRIAVWFGDFEGIEWRLKAHEWDAAEMVMSDTIESGAEFLEHVGIKGMKWGVRKEQVHPSIAHIPKKTRKEASKDAEEFTRAKLFYGEGAGVRRRLINAKVEAKKKKDPLYTKAFDHFVKQTDLSQRASQARRQRKRKDITKFSTKTAKKAIRIANTIPLQQSELLVDDILVESGEEFLEHFGIKGMKWGVRKESTRQKMLRIGNTSQDKKDSRRDVRWENKRHPNPINRRGALKANPGGVQRKVLKTARKTLKPAIKELNNRPKYSSKEAKKQLKADTQLSKQYRNEHRKIVIQHIKAAANQHIEISPSGKWKEKLYITPSGDWIIGLSKTDSVKHVDMPNMSDMDIVLHIRPIFNEDGYIIDYEIVEDSISQGEEFIDYLEHFGIKGMKWGVRRDRSSRVTVTDKGKRLKTSGGHGHRADPSAIRAREAGQKAKASGLKALSDEELAQYAKRLNLEQNVKRLQWHDKPATERFIRRLIGQSPSMDTNEASSQMVKKTIKKVALG